MVKNKKKIFLIDGMAIIYRAHYAMVYNQLTTSAGMHTSAIFGFISSLLKILNDEKPDFLAICSDTKAPTFRHIKYDAYKANTMFGAIYFQDRITFEGMTVNLGMRYDYWIPGKYVEDAINDVNTVIITDAAREKFQNET